LKRLQPQQFAALLALLALFALFFELGRMDIVGDNEGQRATPPAEMLRSGDFVVPTINGTDYLAKPPLLYWAIAGVYKVTGVVSPLTARIPTALAAFGLALSVYFCFRREAGESPARWAAVALLVSPYFLERARWAQIDVPLAFMTFLAIMALRQALRAQALRKRAPWIAGAGLALAAAIMLKGPVPLVFLWAAWAATRLTKKRVSDETMHLGLQLSIAALVLDPALKLGASQIPSLQELLSFPVALVGMLILWTVLAWRAAPSRRLRGLGTVFAVVLVGAAVAAPWGIAVLMRIGWADIHDLLSFQVVDRLHTASKINSGTAFYYLLALPVLLAPWGFLLPLHLLGRPWSPRPPAYRFALITGGLSVLVFSLIAGKEYEYILPAFPFLIVATAHHLASMGAQRDTTRWTVKWARGWAAAMPAFLPLGAVGAAVYIIITLSPPLLLCIEVGALALAAVGLGLLAWKWRTYRLHAIAGLALAAIMIGLLGRGYAMTQKHSHRTFAGAVGQLVRDGNCVEAGWMRIPADFAFYAQARVPHQLNHERVCENLTGSSPYFYIIRERDLEQLDMTGSCEDGIILLGPVTKKRYLLIGNRPLPESNVPGGLTQ
jgi:4-amino-4-deoxy-L-arabinose transferase-like glycosyltransferase